MRNAEEKQRARKQALGNGDKKVIESVGIFGVSASVKGKRQEKGRPS